MLFIKNLLNICSKKKLSYKFIVTLVLPTKILERVMLLERFVDVFRQCKKSLDNKKLQLSSRNNKSRLKIN